MLHEGEPSPGIRTVDHEAIHHSVEPRLRYVIAHGEHPYRTCLCVHLILLESGRRR